MPQSRRKSPAQVSRKIVATVPEQQRVWIENVSPEIDGGAFPIRRVVGERVEVEADLVADGHDQLAGLLAFRHERESEWHEVPLQPLVNDRWQAAFVVEQLGRYVYAVHAWVDDAATWRHNLDKKVADGQDVDVELRSGAALVQAAARRARGESAKQLREWAVQLGDRTLPLADRVAVAQGAALEAALGQVPDRRCASTYRRELWVQVGRERARFGTWYEMFPRSAATEPRHGTFKDCEARLPYIAAMHFDVLYLPPIHPIGTAHRKGRNNSDQAQPGDPGSPWAIGNQQGGHKSVHPELGTLADFRALVSKARDYGIEVALDIAFQCSPDHPYVVEHPEWFRWRPDGTVQYAENPPKKYQDIYPLNFDGEAYRSLWEELKSVFTFWIEQGVKIFRVDNPHTKPLPFWSWVLDELLRDHPDLIFLAEAFTRPKIMYALAKRGFTQSYTYFTWRNAKGELEEYFNELNHTPVRDFFIPNLWPNTPDILHETLQRGGRPAFMMRYVMAATLGANLGIYGPVYELCENEPRGPGIEENKNSEKYEIRHWDLELPHSLARFIGKVNACRRDNQALQRDWSVHFHPTDNDHLLAYSKHSEGHANVILVVLNLDTANLQHGWVHLDLGALGLADGEVFEVEDLLGGEVYTWRGPHNYVKLDPQVLPAHLFRVRQSGGGGR